jgi:hypothetical protein
MPINQPVGANFSHWANKAALELDGSRRRAARCGPRSNMTQGAKIKEIVRLGGRETAS